MMASLLTIFFLAALETGISIDNAVVNAGVLRKMSQLWRRRFLTYGMWIAVFGVRFVLPVLLVSVFRQISPWQVTQTAFMNPHQYSEWIHDMHDPLMAFGGCFLFLVSLHFFVHHGGETRWLPRFENLLKRIGQVRGFSTILALLGLSVFTFLNNQNFGGLFFLSGLVGLVSFYLLDGFKRAIHRFQEEATGLEQKQSSSDLANFIYLEVLDASFSLDGVVAAFSLSDQLWVIMVGLGLGAYVVRAITIKLVERKAIDNWIYLEHGAYYSLAFLSITMWVQSVHELPEWLVGGVSFAIIAASIVHSQIKKSHRIKSQRTK